MFVARFGEPEIVDGYARALERVAPRAVLRTSGAGADRSTTRAEGLVL